MLGRVDMVDAPAEHRDRAGCKAGGVGFTINPARQAGDRDIPPGADNGGKIAGNLDRKSVV